jgi:uncharacterized LabA/DUF88 family protein
MSDAVPPLARAIQLLGAPGLLTVVHDGVDQGRLRALYDRLTQGRGPRAASLDKERLCTAVVRLVLADEEKLALLAREMGKVAAREVGLVLGIPEGDLRDRVLSLPALHLQRERARMMWALATDAREGSREVAAEMVGALNRAMTEAQRMRQHAHSTPELREKVEEAEEHARVIERKAEGMQAQVRRLEQERAEALASAGAKEAQLREEVARRAATDREAALVAARARELETSLEEARAEVQRLREELRAPAEGRPWQWRLSAVEERLRSVEHERDDLRTRWGELAAEHERTREQYRALTASLVVRDQAAQERIRRLREALKDVRRRRANPPAGEGEPTRPQRSERVAIHVDVANLSASAARQGNRRVDFVGLLGILGAGRSVARAVAYAVEQGEPERFRGFCAALREAGYEVRVKRPRARSDGSVKADWDMGLAMDVVEDPARVDAVVVCSGDGDFVPLLQHLRRRGKRVEVAAFRPDTHDDILHAVHAFHALGEEALLR